MSDQQRMVKLCDLWQRRSQKTGNIYFSGFMGDCQILLFKEGKKPHPTRPGEEVIVWKLFVQERDPNRRPQPKPKPEARPGGVIDGNYRELPPLETTPIPPGGDPIDDL